jgi:uncharacterized membrane protein YebE (DUF533 family)
METRRMMALIVAAVAAAGCESIGTAAQSKRNQGAVLGGLLGAGTGAVIGNQSDHAGAGTAIGAGLGALGGGLLGNALEERDRAAQQQQMPPASTTSAPVTSGTKFCPVGGETFPDTVKYCPTHGVELRLKEQ